MQPPSLFPSQGGLSGIGKDFSQHGFPTLLPDRRTSNVSNVSYSSDYPEDYSMDGINNNNSVNYPHPAIQQYQDRLGRFQPDNHFSGSPTMHHNHGPDVLRNVAPPQSFRPDVGGFDGGHYMRPNPNADLGLHMPNVEDTLNGMKLQGQAGIGSSSDLHSFIRFVYSQCLAADIFLKSL